MAEEIVGKGKFCVISPAVDAQRIKRSWKPTVDDAVDHAKRLIERSHDNAHGTKTKRLLVVQVVKVIEVPPAVNVTVRDPNDDEPALVEQEDD